MEQVSLDPRLFPFSWSDVFSGIRHFVRVPGRDRSADSSRVGVLVWLAAEQYGRGVVSGGDRADIADRIDDVLEEPRFYMTLGALAGALRETNSPDPKTVANLSRLPTVLKGALAPLVEGTLAVAWLLEHAPRRQPSTAFEEFVAQSAREPLFFLHSMPTHTARITLEAMRLFVALIAIAAYVQDAVALDPWRALAVAEIYRDSARAVVAGAVPLLDLPRDTELPAGVVVSPSSAVLSERDTEALYEAVFARHRDGVRG